MFSNTDSVCINVSIFLKCTDLFKINSLSHILNFVLFLQFNLIHNILNLRWNLVLIRNIEILQQHIIIGIVLISFKDIIRGTTIRANLKSILFLLTFCRPPLICTTHLQFMIGISVLIWSASCALLFGNWLIPSAVRPWAIWCPPAVCFILVWLLIQLWRYFSIFKLHILKKLFVLFIFSN